MNYNLVAQIILFCSSVGLVQMIFSKIPVLSDLPEVSEIENKSKIFSKLKKDIEEKNPLKDVQYEDLLENVLKKIRFLFLKTDNKIFGWSQELKENSQKRKIKEDGDYWERIKKNTGK